MARKHRRQIIKDNSRHIGANQINDKYAKWH